MKLEYLHEIVYLHNTALNRGVSTVVVLPRLFPNITSKIMSSSSLRTMYFNNLCRNITLFTNI